MCDPQMLANVATATQIAGAVTSTVGSYNKAKGERAAANYNAAVARNNAQMSEWMAEDAVRRGQDAKRKTQLQTAQLKGRQRAMLAERGIDLGEGSALDLLTDTDLFGQIDANTAVANAAREAYGYRSQGAGFLAEEAMQRMRADSISPGKAALTSALTGAGSVASTWYSFSSKGVTPFGGKKTKGNKLSQYDDPGY